MYQVRRPSRSEHLPIRHLSYHVRLWGEPSPDKLPLVMVHGWMDVGASFQFVVDAFKNDHFVIAPDWRGYGLTDVAPTDNFWFPDYLADLELLLDHYSPERPVNLVGHSMGGNVAMLYAGTRPARIHRLVNLEGFGMPDTRADKAPARYAQWLDELKRYHRHELNLTTYADAEGVARRLMKTNPRLSADKAEWLATRWAAPDASGRWGILGHAAHKIINSQISRVDEILALYRNISAPTLCVEASDDSLGGWWKGRYTLDEYHERLRQVPDARIGHVEDAGHMLHHDQPEAVAALIEDFLAS